jgi:hypothetical protein
MFFYEEINKLESEYYKIVCPIDFNSDAGKWMGKVRIIRKDTNENVNGGFRVFDEKRSLIETKILEKLDTIKSELLSLGVPYEWNSRGRLILIRYLRLRSKITEYGVCCDRVIAGKEDKELFSIEYTGFLYQIIQDALAITRSIEMLFEQEKIEMLTLPESVFHDPSNSWNLDEIDSRVDIIKFFLNPSEQEIKTHKMQTKKTN